MAKLSPKDFNSITDWVKQFIKDDSEPLPELIAPYFEVWRNYYSGFNYYIINDNDVEVNVEWGGRVEAIPANSKISMSYMWTEGQMTYNKGYRFTADGYQSTPYVYLFVVRPEEYYKITIRDTYGGTITCNQGTQAKVGDPLIIQVNTDEGYKFVSLEINGESIYKEGKTKYIVVMPAEDVVIAGGFEYEIYGTLEAPTCEVTYNDDVQVVYSIKNSNAVDVKFVSSGSTEIVSASGALELTHIWEADEKQYLITGYFAADHYINSAELIETVDRPKAIVMPVKGDLITMSLGNAEPAQGTNNLYRVLKTSGTKAEVVTMFDISNLQNFGSSQVYEGSSLDIALNTTFYNSLSDEAKAAIVDKTFKQDSWFWGTSGSPVYSGYYGSSNPGTSSYSVSLANASFGSEITRKVYALSVQDVIDYVTDTSVGDGKLQNYNIWKMFWNTTSQPSTITYPWLRSAGAGNSNYCWIVNGYSGGVNNYLYYNSRASRPALTIDLSKIDFEIQE